MNSYLNESKELIFIRHVFDEIFKKRSFWSYVKKISERGWVSMALSFFFLWDAYSYLRSDLVAFYVYLLAGFLFYLLLIIGSVKSFLPSIKEVYLPIKDMRLGLSFDDLNNICKYSITFWPDKNIRDKAISEILSFLELNPFKEGVFYGFYIRISGLFFGVITIFTFASIFFGWTYNEGGVQKDFLSVDAKIKFLYFVLIFLMVFLPVMFLLYSLNLKSKNERAIVALKLIRLGACNDSSNSPS